MGSEILSIVLFFRISDDASIIIYARKRYGSFFLVHFLYKYNDFMIFQAKLFEK